MTSAKFSGFMIPSTLVNTRSTQPPCLWSVFGYPHPPSEQTSYVHAPSFLLLHPFPWRSLHEIAMRAGAAPSAAPAATRDHAHARAHAQIRPLRRRVGRAEETLPSLLPCHLPAPPRPARLQDFQQLQFPESARVSHVSRI